MIWVSLILFLFGLWLFYYRLRPSHMIGSEKPKEWPKVSIVVPARNEARNIQTLLFSLCALDYPNYEVIVIDDDSEDETYQLASACSVRTLRSRPRPPGWVGKSWACFQGAQVASGDCLLFTDADTIHAPTSLKKAVQLMLQTEAGLVSAPPFHRSSTLWERLLGPFHLLVLAASGAYMRPKGGQVYAIGQYLLFDKDCYWVVGSHESIRAEVAEDIALAERVLAGGYDYAVYQRPHLYQVRMYDTFLEHVIGWRRILRAGLGKSSWENRLGMIFIINSLFLGGLWTHPVLAAGLYLALVLFFTWRQSAEGEMSIWGAVFYPLSVLLFCGVTALGLVDRILGRPALWKGRQIEVVRGSS